MTMLDARPAPAGPMPVVVGNGFGGVLFHEATGHGLESDAVQKHASVYAGRLGEQLAASIVTAYDDGTMPGRVGDRRDRRRGHAVPGDARDRRGRAVHLPVRPAARAQGRAPLDRQRPPPELPPPADPAHDQHLHRAASTTTREDIIAGVDRGLYAVSFAGGQVEPATGDFVFGMSEGYLIEDGKVTAPVRGATLIGNGIDVLTRIDAVGNDLAMKSGFCGKDGQQVPVGTGQPTVRISELTVGGTDV